MHVHLAAVQRIVDDFALLEQLAVPQIDELLAEMRPHVVAEHLWQTRQQGLLVGRREHGKRVPVHVEHVNFLHAALDELRMHVREHAEIGDAGRTCLVEQTS